MGFSPNKTLGPIDISLYDANLPCSAEEIMPVPHTPARSTIGLQRAMGKVSEPVRVLLFLVRMCSFLRRSNPSLDPSASCSAHP
jgi:hypothetical protein